MALIPLVPRVLALRTPGELEQEVAERTQALKQANARLAQLLDEQAQTHAALRDSEQRLHLLTDALPILMAYVDSEQRYRFVNHTYAWVWRLPCEQILGRTVESLLGPEAYAMARPRIERALAGEPVSYDLVTTQPDGTQKYNLR
jgi:PAS domain S-box-containing protein